MHANEEHYRRLERMYYSAPINSYFLPKPTVSEAAAEIVIAVRPEFFHAAGAVHGSVYFKALDDAAFFAANSLVSDVFVLTVSYNLYLTRPISEGVLRAKGRVVHRSQNLLLAEAELLDGQDRQAGRGSGSFMRSKIIVGPEVGYV